LWIERLLRHNVRYEGPTKRGRGGDAESVIIFKDPDGVMLELVAHGAAESRSDGVWDGAPGITREAAIRGFHKVTLWVETGEATSSVLTDAMGFREHSEEETTRRYVVADGGPGKIVDVRSIGGFGRGADGVGVVHHVAFAVADDDAQLAMRQRVVGAGLRPTPVVDRTYFHSVYFREPGGVLYELATLPPGFTIDEPKEHLGESLKLPAQYESMRAQLEAELPPLRIPSLPTKTG
jgi:glyoxalase family protein